MKWWILLFAITQISCARPDYVSKEDLHNQNNPAGQGCTGHFSTTQVCAQITWLKTPSSTDAAEFTLELSGDTALFDDVSILLWMRSMGHGSAPVKIQKISATQYHVTNVYFIMPGDWDVRLTLKKAGQNIDQLFVALMVP